MTNARNATHWECIEVDPNGPWHEGKYLIQRTPDSFGAIPGDIVVGYQPEDLARLYYVHGFSEGRGLVYLDMRPVGTMTC